MVNLWQGLSLVSGKWINGEQKSGGCTNFNNESDRETPETIFNTFFFN